MAHGSLGGGASGHPGPSPPLKGRRAEIEIGHMFLVALTAPIADRWLAFFWTSRDLFRGEIQPMPPRSSPSDRETVRDNSKPSGARLRQHAAMLRSRRHCDGAAVTSCDSS